ncbi:tetratricopeptide repeat protein [Anabaena sp. UHCC 0253]|uniref:tetratricopeptide repeat protein n=1 Tax=Anabaena sp. UHCC 0253 TaxID=2590019 RepID=UPI001448A2A4|nr:tetratricopeptide repeat protein [Anabaena sp. UHCC 0253]MTJ51762.1 tetratricopeptide repeat protein [Anabaena sp. UHCC 0253]
MNIDDALKFTQSLIENHTKKPLNDSQMTVLRGCLEGKLYREIDNLYNFSEDYSKEIGFDLWKILSKILGVKVTKNNFRTVIEQKLQTEKKKISNYEISQKCNEELRDFVGRDTAINDINNLIKEGEKIIVIQAAGGVGKSTLAKQYLNIQGFELVLPLEMAKDKENITAVESVIEEWLKQHFQEEPGREFRITLDRLKLQLQTRKIGVLIDNLEPALDKQGRFIEKHNLYVELLRVLADNNVQSITLITSRERLCDERVNGISHYPLSVLDVTAWAEFFTSRKIKIDTPSLEAMHKIYGGNAKAMDILLGVIRTDYDGDMSAYWQENCTLVETELKNLVESQFKRLQTLDTEAYKLLFRLGCFRYQDVPRVSINALLALLWDISEDKQRDVIKSLRNRCLVEFEKGEYWLHPVIREQGIERLKASGEWEEINRKAAEFWTNLVKTVETVDDARKAFEAYYHYIDITDFPKACSVILHRRPNKWEKPNKWESGSSLGNSLIKLGLISEINFAVTNIINNRDKINQFDSESKLYSILANIRYIKGNIHEAITFYQKSEESVTRNLEDLISDKICCSYQTITQKTFELKELKLGSMLNIALCKIQLLKIEEALEICKNVQSTLDNESENFLKRKIIVWLYLAYLYSCIEFKKQAAYFVKKVEDDNLMDVLDIWVGGLRLIFLGMTYKNLQEIKKAEEFYLNAISFSDKTHSTLIKGKALNALSEIYREKQNLEKALLHHLESIEILDKIGAKCDLAEAYYQLGLTYQKMGDPENSNTNFDEAMRLFNEMEAPKQVEKVEKAKIQN